MFERRLKIILWIICLTALGLMLRAGMIQIVQNQTWVAAASKLLTQRQLIDTARGRILDFKGREIAVDVPCMDACVDYAAITEDWDQYSKWLHDQALASCQHRLGDSFTKAPLAERKRLVSDESARVRLDVQAMWKDLAKAGGLTDDQLDDIRRSIMQRVNLRRQYVLWQNYQKAMAAQKGVRSPFYSRWFSTGDSNDADDPLDDYSVDVAEQSQSHVILPAIDTALYNDLAKNAESFPGLHLRPGRRRAYPFGPVACHVLGRLASVTARQIDDDPNKSDSLRKYWPNDLAGLGGVEALYEPQLRGVRGEQTLVSPGEDAVPTVDPIPGRDVRLSLDFQLQAQIEKAFARRREFGEPVSEVRENQPGAAVVIDVATGQVRALVSYPLFDPNKIGTDYARLRLDDLNNPLLDRALGGEFEPGSTVKPLMGLGALSDGAITPQTTIECTGYFIIDGHRYPNGRCWTMSEFGLTHKEVPTSDPMPTNDLTVVDAIERSCNVFFENVADRMGMTRQRYWYQRFGLGRPTGIGLPELAGHIPDPANDPPALLRHDTWLAGIGQGRVRATPIQMANAAAVIARDGIWMSPTLSADPRSPGDEVDLHLSPQALAAVKDGMFRVVNKRGGTGKLPHNDPPDAVDSLLVAGKTGTSQASRLTVTARDDHGTPIMEDGHEKRILVDPTDPAVRTWYIGGGLAKTEYAHNWFIGYAPADHPRIAFAVFAEYGGTGNPVAASIVRDVLAACIEQGYLGSLAIDQNR